MCLLELIRDLDDDEMSDIVFDSDDEENTSSKKGKKKQPKLDLSSVFASAEEFASILEDEGSSFAAPGTSNVISNKDNASKYENNSGFYWILNLVLTRCQTINVGREKESMASGLQ